MIPPQAMISLSLALSIVYLGTSTTDTSMGAKGIYQFTFNAETGAISSLSLAAKTDNPTFLAHHPSGKFLYAVNEVKAFQGQSGGGVSAFAVDVQSGALTLLNQQPVGGNSPCHLAIDATGRVLVTANYGDGSVSVFPILPDGKLGPRSDFHEHTGRGPNPDRQKGPHAHGITFSPDNRFVLVNDLGIDEILVYRLDVEKARLLPHQPASVRLAPGAGPRHFCFAPEGRHGYAINELDNTVTRFDWDAQKGVLTPRESVPTLPPDFKSYSTTAELVLHPNGDFLYASNRGHDSIAVYRRDRATGSLSLIEHVFTGGSEPRSFALSPDGHWLIAANQRAQTLQLFRVDDQTGALTPHGEPVAAPSPICLLF
jgi:6-phosphogluconolactonase